MSSAHAAVLFANDAFYDAFSRASLEAMDALWARAAPVTCVHPGWPLLRTREQIMDVWQRLFESGQPPLVCRAPEAYVAGDIGFVICYEQLPDALLIATNIFCREQDQWRMVHHQSGQTQGIPAELPETHAPTRQQVN